MYWIVSVYDLDGRECELLRGLFAECNALKLALILHGCVAWVTEAPAAETVGH